MEGLKHISYKNLHVNTDFLGHWDHFASICLSVLVFVYLVVILFIAPSW